MAVTVSFILGVAVGAVLGYILPAGVQFWIGRREWKEAARELELTDRLLETLVDATSADRPVMGPSPPWPGEVTNLTSPQ